MDINKFMNDNPFIKDLFYEFTKSDLYKMEIVYYASDMTVIKRFSQSNYVYLIINGICGIFNELDNGEAFCSYKISNYDVIGLSEVLSVNDVRNADIQTLTDVIAFKIKKDDLREWMVRYPEFYNKIIYHTINRLHATLRKHIECKKYSSHANIVSYLIYSYELYRRIYEDCYTGDVKINETRDMISDFIGVSIRSANSTIEILKKKGLVTVRLGKIYINQQQYRNLAEYKSELLLNNL